jgi:hypothetical protein
VPPVFSKESGGSEVTMHYFTRILLDIEREEKRKIVIQQEPTTYRIYILHHDSEAWFPPLRFKFFYSPDDRRR